MLNWAHASHVRGATTSICWLLSDHLLDFSDFGSNCLSFVQPRRYVSLFWPTGYVGGPAKCRMKLNSLLPFSNNHFQAIVALTFAQYAAKPFFPECTPPDDAVRLLAAVCLCKYQNFHSVSKLLFGFTFAANQIL